MPIFGSTNVDMLGDQKLVSQNGCQEKKNQKMFGRHDTELKTIFFNQNDAYLTSNSIKITSYFYKNHILFSSISIEMMLKM